MKQLIFFKLALLLLLLAGCWRVDTSPLGDFEVVREEIYCRSGEEIYPFQECIDTLLEKELTAEEAIYIALVNNRTIRATYEELGIARAALVQAGLLRNPIFAMSYRFTTSAGITDLIDLSVLQNFLEALLIPLKKRAASHELESVKWHAAAEVLDLIGRTKMAFYSLQLKEHLLELNREYFFALECSYEASKRLFEAGNIRELEVANRAAPYEAEKIDLLALEIEVKQARERLNVLMGLCGEQTCWKAAKTLPQICEKEWGDVENRAIVCSLDLEKAREQIYATAALIGIDTTRIVFPQFDVGPCAEREEGVWFVGPAFALGIPFFDWGQARKAAGRAELFRQWDGYLAHAIAIRATARLDQFRLKYAARQWRYYQDVVIPLHEHATQLSLLQHNAMQLSVLALLDAKQMEILSKIKSLQAVEEYWMAYIELETLLKGHQM